MWMQFLVIVLGIILNENSAADVVENNNFVNVDYFANMNQNKATLKIIKKANEEIQRHAITTHEPLKRNARRGLLENLSSITQFMPPLKNILRMSFLGGPCNCARLMCECCSKFFHHDIFHNMTCTTIAYNPTNRTVTVVLVRQPYKEVVKEKNMPVDDAKVTCMDVPNRWMDINKGLSVCVVIHKIVEDNGNLNMCLSVDSRVGSKSAMVLFFDCMTMGEDVHQPRPPKTDYPYPLLPFTDYEIHSRPPHFVEDKSDDK